MATGSTPPISDVAQDLYQLTSTQQNLLCAMVEADHDSPNGQQIIDTYNENFEQEISGGAAYPGFDALREQGFIRKGVSESRANTYEITERGKAALRDRHTHRERILQEAGIL